MVEATPAHCKMRHDRSDSSELRNETTPSEIQNEKLKLDTNRLGTSIFKTSVASNTYSGRNAYSLTWTGAREPRPFYTLLDPGLRGQRTGPTLPVAPRARRHQPGRGWRELEDGEGHWQRGLSAPSPPRRRRRGAPSALCLQRAAVGGGGGGGLCHGGGEGWQVGRERKVAS